MPERRSGRLGDPFPRHTCSPILNAPDVPPAWLRFGRNPSAQLLLGAVAPLITGLASGATNLRSIRKFAGDSAPRKSLAGVLRCNPIHRQPPPGPGLKQQPVDYGNSSCKSCDLSENRGASAYASATDLSSSLAISAGTNLIAFSEIGIWGAINPRRTLHLPWNWIKTTAFQVSAM
jgi:hypothetical protein